MLAKAYRLTNSPLIVRTLRNGRACPTSLWVLKWLPNQLNHPRFAFIVSNKISKRATVRNTIKRRLREAVRTRIAAQAPNADIILIAKTPLVNTSYGIICKTLQLQIATCFSKAFRPFQHIRHKKIKR